MALNFLIIQQVESIDIVWKNMDLLRFYKHFTKPKSAKSAALEKCLHGGLMPPSLTTPSGGRTKVL